MDRSDSGDTPQSPPDVSSGAGPMQQPKNGRKQNFGVVNHRSFQVCRFLVFVYGSTSAYVEVVIVCMVYGRAKPIHFICILPTLHKTMCMICPNPSEQMKTHITITIVIPVTIFTPVWVVDFVFHTRDLSAGVYYCFIKVRTDLLLQ